MNSQELEYVRIEVRHALKNLSGGTKGQLEAFSEHPPADKNKHPRRHLHKVVLDGGEGSKPSVVNALTTPVYVLETRSRRRPFPPMHDVEFYYAPWRRAVNALEEHQQAWVRYCYGFDLNFRYQTLMCQYVWDEFQKCLVERKLQSRVVKKLIGLVWLAAQEVAASRNNGTYQEYAGAALARMMSVDRSTWLRVYAPHWAKFKGAFNTLDYAALHNIIRHEQIEGSKVLEM
ncbi:bacteriophage antitermination protein Q [Trabulsiella odontotermitis]|uniref:bacteriophage antitermination protein Q n=1 Tax=Trabulsiella odontotermitis TaxID=379893 RepID=UPI0024B80C45|nr:bacteriophage antitermination protein Q [Trabulsiella odontotermitis]WHP32822.1 bacteriophage antitermination protein Q [Trabulsiella odontotermitis]